jgi:hypothetical protein
MDARDPTVVIAALRVLSAYAVGVPPACEDIWILQLSITACDAADLLLGHEELARKIAGEQGSISRQAAASTPSEGSQETGATAA